MIADYSQIELRIVAKISGDAEVLSACAESRDLHTLTAEGLTGREAVTKDDRNLAKAVIFGLLYGMGANGLQSYALRSYGIKKSLDEASLYRRRFAMDSFVCWTAYEENLRDPSTRLIMYCIADQMYLGTRYFRMQGGVLQDPFSDDELRGIQVPTLLLIGQQEVIYDPEGALERARRLIPNSEGELVPRASHEMTISKHEFVDRRVLEFLKRSA